MRFLWLLAAAAPLLGSVSPADWVPARWNWTDPQTLELLSGTPVNCLLVKSADAAFADKAKERGIVVLAVINSDTDPGPATEAAIRAHYQGVVLEGNFAEGTVARLTDRLGGSQPAIVQLTARNRMNLSGTDPIVGTYQGVWPGIEVLDS